MHLTSPCTQSIRKCTKDDHTTHTLGGSKMESMPFQKYKQCLWFLFIKATILHRIHIYASVSSYPNPITLKTCIVMCVCVYLCRIRNWMHQNILSSLEKLLYLFVEIFPFFMLLFHSLNFLVVLFYIKWKKSYIRLH